MDAIPPITPIPPDIRIRKGRAALQSKSRDRKPKLEKPMPNPDSGPNSVQPIDEVV